MFSGAQESNIEQLAALQRIDKQFDAIIYEKGSLPSSIESLQFEIAKLAKQKAIGKESIDELHQNIADLRGNIKYLENQVEKYEEQLKATKNDREYDAIREDLEIQKIEIKLLKRKIPEKMQAIKDENTKIGDIEKTMFIRENSLIAKKESLHTIQEKTGENEKQLSQERERIIPMIDKEVYERYTQVREAKLDAAVDVVENACSGCFIIVPYQRQLEIRLQKNLYSCESCGRILLYVIKPAVVETKKRTRRGRPSSRKKAQEEMHS
ncbi:MAG: C4-type zinc ribbon domain-containing protein [Bacteroidota bacterium]